MVEICECVSDVVISAPYGEGGGVIYIYDGSASGINEQPSQVAAKSITFSHILYNICSAQYLESILPSGLL